MSYIQIPPSGGGTVTSVGLTMPNIFSVSGSPVTDSGTIAVTLATEAANVVLAGPTTGSAAAPTFRALVNADFTNPVQFNATATATGIAVTPSTNMAVTGKAYRQGQYLILNGKVTWSGAGDASPVIVSIASLSGSPVIDTTALVGGSSTTNQGRTMLGQGMLFSAGNGWFAYNPVYASTTTFKFAGGSADLTGDVPASGSGLDFHVELPIVGWTS